MKKTCSKCKRSKDVSEFAKNKSRKDGLQIYCRACKKLQDAKHYQKHKVKQLERNKKNYRKYKEEVDKIKESHGCLNCGEKNACCLDFHHIKDDKTECIAFIRVRASRQKLFEEIAKCVVLCSNCHRKVHAGLLEVDKSHLCEVSL